jgi:hypothetical protein
MRRRRRFEVMGKRLTLLIALAAFLVLVGVFGDWQRAVVAARTPPGSYAVQRVLASREASTLRYFPRQDGSSRCAIPFVFRSVEGTCTTRVAPRLGYSGQIFVNFSERWPWRKFHYSGTPRRPLHHHWVFDLLPSGKVVFARQTGDFPPNYAR